jgi:uncharacterized protein with HEPN domain
MLREKKNDLFHLLNILESIGKIEKYVGKISTADEFINANDQLNYNATLTLLANLGESFGKLSDETQSELNNINLSSIRGMRNRIVHDYTGLNSFIVFDVVKNKLNQIRDSIEECVNINVRNGKFDREEYEISESNKYYQHIRFEKIRAS